jgi:hypothetical protein
MRGVLNFCARRIAHALEKDASSNSLNRTIFFPLRYEKSKHPERLSPLLWPRVLF